MSINHIKFVIESKDQSLIDEQKKLLSENILSLHQNIKEELCLHYIKDQQIYDDVLTVLTKQKLQAINTFKKEQHFKGLYKSLPAFKKDNNEYCVISSKNEFWFIGNPKIDTSIFIPRLITELLLRKMEDRGAVLSHATGIELQGKGLFLTSNPGGGKTTLMTKIFDSGKDVSLLSNDRVFSHFENNIVPIMEYVPFQVRFEINTIFSSPFLKKYFTVNNEIHNIQQRKKGEVSLRNISAIFPRLKIKDSSKINFILIPQINLTDLEGKNFKIEIANLEKVERVLTKNTFTPYDLESPRQPWLCPRNKSENELIEQSRLFVEKLSSIPAYTITYQPNASNNEICHELAGLSK